MSLLFPSSPPLSTMATIAGPGRSASGVLPVFRPGFELPGENLLGMPSVDDLGDLLPAEQRVVSVRARSPPGGA